MSLGLDCTRGVLGISAGYWSTPTFTRTGSLPVTLRSNFTLDSYLNGSLQLEVYECSSVQRCVGGSVLITDTLLVIPDVCGMGYVGDLCSGCEVGWASTGGGKCVECHSQGVLIFSLVLVPSAVLAVLAALVAVVAHNPRQKSQARAVYLATIKWHHR